jgi:hypothetical protein
MDMEFVKLPNPLIRSFLLLLQHAGPERFVLHF